MENGYIYICLLKDLEVSKIVSVMPTRSCIEFFNTQRNFGKETKQQEYPLAMERRKFAFESHETRLNRKLEVLRGYI